MRVAAAARTRTRTQQQLPPLLLVVVVVVWVVLQAGAAEAAAVAAAPVAAAPGTAVFGYLPEWRHRFLDEDHAHRLRGVICGAVSHLILFSLEVGSRGELAALDRFPSSERMAILRRECPDVKVLLCLGGNSRSGAFSAVVQDAALRDKFAHTLAHFLQERGLHGVDWNWEYPASKEDWVGLGALVDATRSASAALGVRTEMTLAYYPDGRQEGVLKALGMDAKVDFLHSMAYDNVPGEHSTMEFALQTLERYRSAGLSMRKLTLGLPFYARSTRTGEWKTYHDVVEQLAGGDAARVASTDLLNGEWYYNSPRTIGSKVRLALEHGAGGVMIWESGQDTVDGALHGAIAGVYAELLSEKSEL